MGLTGGQADQLACVQRMNHAGDGDIRFAGQIQNHGVEGRRMFAEPLAGVEGKQLRGVMVRKEPKQHGTGKYVEGPYAAGEELVIVEDVVTTGGSSLLAIERCEAAGLKVKRVFAIVDRLEGGREAFAAKGYELTTLLTIEDFGITQ